MIDTGLASKVVVVTGANNPGGIGAAVARAFADQGARLFLHYYRVNPTGSEAEASAEPGEARYSARNAGAADRVVEMLSAMGAEAVPWEADLSDPHAVPPLFDAAERALGPVQVLVNNAAHWEADTLLPEGVDPASRHVELWTDRPARLSTGGFDRSFAVNARAVALLMSEFAARHIARDASWGRIVNVSTDGAYCFPSEVSYGASKLALEGLTRSAAVEFGRYGITVNVISPGPIQTGWITPQLEREILPTIPLGRVGEPPDVADVVLFLASDQARWLTGQTLHVGGGHRM
jgi:3-oxoacyl-[acyl-carrier protein] reductase